MGAWKSVEAGIGSGRAEANMVAMKQKAEKEIGVNGK